MDLDAFFASELDAHASVLAATRDAVRAPFLRLVEACAGAAAGDNTIILFGNGGSAADAQHLATELVVRYKSERDPIRALALTTDTSWHWAFRAVGQGSTRQAYDRFWRNAIRWLIRDPELKYLRVIAQKDRVRLRSPLKIVIRAFNPDYSAAAGVPVTYEIRRLAGGKTRQASAVTDARGELRLELSPGARGAYAVRATAEIAGRHNSEQTVVLVDPSGPEDREPAARDNLLRELSRVTGGKYLGSPKTLPDLAFRPPGALQVNWRRDEELWNRWWYLLLALTLLGAEWLLRRRYGYL